MPIVRAFAFITTKDKEGDYGNIDNVLML